MKKLGLIVLASAALFAAGCQQEEMLNPDELAVLKAGVEDEAPATRVGFGTDYAFYWSSGDKLNILNTNGNKSFVSINPEGAGKPSATFTGYATIEGYAVYPYSAENEYSLSGNELTFSFSDLYSYGKVDETWFVEPKGSGVSFNPAMAGKIENGSVKIWHLGGVFALSIDPMPVETGTLTFSTNSFKISGDYKFDLTKLGTEGINAVPTDKTSERTVSITFKGANTDKPGVFYIPVPVGNYEGINLKIVDANDDVKMNINDAHSYNITRNQTYGIGIKQGQIVAGGQENTIKDQNDAETVLSNMADQTNPNLSVVAEADVLVWNLPASFTTVGGNSTFNLEYKTAPKSITINQSGATDSDPAGTSYGVVNITIPATADLEDIAVNLLTPNLTVNIRKAGETQTLELASLNSRVANGTLVIGAGINVNALTAEAGTVEVAADATVTALTVNTSSTITVNGTVTEVKAATSEINVAGTGIVNAVSDIRPETEKSEPLIIVATTGSDNAAPSVTITNTPSNSAVVTSTLETTVRKALLTGGTAKLSDNLVISSPLIVSGEAATLDLNGKSITPSGNLEAFKTLGLIIVRRGAKLTISGEGSIDTGNNNLIYSAIQLLYSDDDSNETVRAVLTVNGNPTIKGYYYAIAGNGNRHGTDVTINGGELSAYANEDNAAIYHPHVGNLIVNNGKLTGYNAAIEMRAGYLTLNGGEMIATGIPTSSQSNGNGTTIVGAAVAVSQHKTNNILSVKIPEDSKAILTGDHALYEEDCEDVYALEDIQISVAGGKFNGRIFSENCMNFITGDIETFNHPSALNYLADGANVKVTLDGHCTYSKPAVLNSAATATLDLNGKNLTYNGYDSNRPTETISAILVKGGGNLTVTATLAGSTFTSNGYVFGTSSVGDNNTLNLKAADVTYISDNASVVNVVRGVANIENGTFKINNENKSFILNCKDQYYKIGEATINVKGGEFVGFNPAATNGENPVSNFVAEGYFSYPNPDNENSYIVTSSNNASITNSEMLHALAQQGGSGILSSDLTLSMPVMVTKDFALNLNDHTISAASSYSTNTEAGALEGSNQGIFYVTKGAELKLSNGTVDGSNTYAAVLMTEKNIDDLNASDEHKALSAKLTADDVTFKGETFAITGNGTRNNTDINLTDCSLDAKVGLYQPQYGTATLTNTIVTGSSSAIEIRSGSMTINGGTYKSTASNFDSGKNGNGTTVTGAAIAVSQHDTQQAINLVIEKGTFEGKYALYENDFHGAPTDNIKIAVNGGTFNGPVYSANCSNFITGGTFTNNDFDYSAAEKTFTIKTVDGFKWFGNVVNLKEKTPYGHPSFSGQTVKLGADIDLKDVEWTPMGQTGTGYGQFTGTLDGQQKTISNLTVKATTTGEEGAGLFGWLDGTVKNLKMSNVSVSAYRRAGAIAGYLQGSAKIIGCEVKDITISVTPNKKDGKFENGDKAGGIAGFANAGTEISGCVVSGGSVTAYRDCGGVVGIAYGDSTDDKGVFHSGTNVTGNTVSNFTVTADQSVCTMAEYEEGEGKSFNADKIVGREDSGFAVDSSNTAGDTVIVEEKANKQ